MSPKNSESGYLQLLVSVVTNEDNAEGTADKRQLRSDKEDEATPTFRCMGRGDDNRKYLRLWDCFPPGELICCYVHLFERNTLHSTFL